MNTHILLFLYFTFILFVVVSSRHVEDVQKQDSLAIDDGVRKHQTDHNRRRRRRWQMNYGYDYPPPTHGYYPDTRDYDRNQQDLLPQIVRLLEEISVYVKRPQVAPPPPPQPIYIPYPVPYPVLQYSSCSEKGTKRPNITNRFPEMEDTNQNWGFVTNNDDDSDDFDGSRPISFEPIKPIQPMKRPAPKVEHGSSQDSLQSTVAPNLNNDGLSRTPTMCNAAILSCCADDKTQQKQCFNNFGCGLSYDNGKACSDTSINKALELFKAAYAPIQ